MGNKRRKKTWCRLAVPVEKEKWGDIRKKSTLQITPESALRRDNDTRGIYAVQKTKIKVKIK